MAFGSLILTDAANAYTAQEWASSGQITVTRVAVGSGFPGVSDYVPGYTDLKIQVMNATITGINNIVPGQLTVRSNISSANTSITFNVNEIGIFGTFGLGSETLLAYATTGANTGDTVVPTGSGTPIVKDYALLMIFQQAISSSGVIQLVQVVGLHAATHLDNGVDPIPVATTSRTGSLIKLSGNVSDTLLGTGAWGNLFFPGFVSDYAGQTAPSGWLLCDGSSYLRATYPNLFTAIGTTFGSVNGSSFNVPDIRGRFTVGAGHGIGLTNRVLGTAGGEESHVLAIGELAAHTHGITDPGHTHVVNDPQHSHTVNDPGHGHSIVDPGHIHGISDPGHAHSYETLIYVGGGGQFAVGGAYTEVAGRTTSTSATGISINAGGSNISVSNRGSGISISQVGTGVSINSGVTGISTQSTGSGTGHNTMPPFVALNKIIKY